MLWLPVIPLLLGLWLAIRGWRGRRIDDHPLCRRCGYDLIASGLGVEGGATKCPECGRDVTAAGSVRIGHRRTSKFALTLGILLLLVGLGGGGGLGYVQARGVNWNPYKPLWLLKREACGSNGTSAQLAVREILGRAQANRLSQSQIDSIVSEALLAQPNPNVKWYTWWGDAIELAWQAGKVSDATIIQYAKNALNVSYAMEFPARMRPARMAMLYVGNQPARAGSGTSLLYEMSTGDVVCDGKTMVLRGEGRSRGNLSSGGYGRSGSSIVLNLSVGHHTLTMHCRVKIWPLSAGGPMSGTSMTMSNLGLLDQTQAGNEPAPLAEWDMPLNAEVEIVGPEVELVQRVRDPQLETGIRASFDLRGLRTLATTAGTMIVLDMSVAGPPMNVAFDVFARAAGREWLIAECVGEAGSRTGSARPRTRLPVADFPVDLDEVDLIFRPNLRLAEERGWDRVWDGEMVIGDVRIERVRPGGGS